MLDPLKYEGFTFFVTERKARLILFPNLDLNGSSNIQRGNSQIDIVPKKSLNIKVKKIVRFGEGKFSALVPETDRDCSEAKLS